VRARRGRNDDHRLTDLRGRPVLREHLHDLLELLERRPLQDFNCGQPLGNFLKTFILLFLYGEKVCPSN